MIHPPQNWLIKRNKEDSEQSSISVRESSTSNDTGNLIKIPPTEARSDIQANATLDKSELFANSIIPDLKKFDDEHFALIKMIITKDIYDVFIKQKDQAKM